LEIETESTRLHCLENLLWKRLWTCGKTYYIMISDASQGFNDKVTTSLTYNSKNGKAIPLQAWTDPEGSRKLRLPDFKTIGT